MINSQIFAILVDTLRLKRWQLSTITGNKVLPGKAGYNCVFVL